ncbi:MAG: response regulator, partial [Myxococcota bacterium]
CDRVIGLREVVVKELGPLLAPLPLFAGGAISGSGRVRLLLDPAALLRLAGAGPAIAHDHVRLDGRSRAGTEDGVTRVPGSGARRRALVVDDSRAIREAVRGVVRSAGYWVDVAEDGEAAWTALAAAAYELVITDIEMPRLSGLELIARMRASPRLCTIPVIVVSSRGEPAHRDRADALGVGAFLAKPLSPGQLRRTLDRIAGRPVEPSAQRPGTDRD